MIRVARNGTEPLRLFKFHVLTKLCAIGTALLFAGCAGGPYTGVNGSFYKTLDYQARSRTKGEVLILLASTAPVAEHYHVGEVRVSRGTMDSDAALYDAMRDLGVKYGFDGVNDIYCGENYSLTEPYVCTGAAFVISEQQAANRVAPAQQLSTPAEPVRFYGEENVDFGVKPQRELQTNVGTPTPLQLPADIGSTISTQELNRLLPEIPLLVDVLEGDHQYSIKNSVRIPEGGRPGSFADRNQQTLASMLDIFLDEEPDVPIVFFCAGARCWESYNAALRAHAAGHRNLYWYRGGLAAWQEAGLPLESLEDATLNGIGFPF
jgi:rhodanese-related sulfurtransferase